MDKPLVISVKTLVRDEDGRYLAIRRSPSSKNNAGQWDLPGGKTDPGEDVLEALAREAREETGLEIRPHTLAGSSQSEAPTRVIVYLILLSDRVGGTFALSDEHDDYRWVQANELAELDFCEQFKPITDHSENWWV